MTIRKNEVPEGLTPEAAEAIDEARPFESIEDHDESAYGWDDETGVIFGDDQHGWDLYLGLEPVSDAEMLTQYLARVDLSLDDFKQLSVYRANVDRPGFEWLRAL